MTSYNDKDLEFAKEIGALKAEIQATNRLLIHINDAIKLSIKDDRREKDVMWQKLDKHSKFINWIIGVGAGASTIITALSLWLKTKLGHE